jgi:multisubunit Na+/H+ antiporter MnhG subunit
LVFRRFDNAIPRPGGPAAAAAIGVTLCTLGVIGLSAVGLGGLLTSHRAALLGISVTAPLTLAMIAAGAGLVCARIVVPRR